MSDDETEVEVGIGRMSGTDEEITITITTPRGTDTPRRRIYVSLTPEAFALALTGRGAIKGKMCVYEYPKAAKK